MAADAADEHQRAPGPGKRVKGRVDGTKHAEDVGLELAPVIVAEVKVTA